MYEYNMCYVTGAFQRSSSFPLESAYVPFFSIFLPFVLVESLKNSEAILFLQSEKSERLDFSDRRYQMALEVFKNAN